ncbi:hypothetical protein HZB07_05615 [Candidatus Saganbacteria bacterium]|nr:hypothetical protein [Candidatus Saganbacteria bacterium]
MKAQVRPQENWVPTKDFLPLILGKDFGGELKAEELKKLDLFEKGLANELKREDTIEQAVTKIVRMALAAEFGATLIAASSARPMISTITHGIMHDPQLRKQALIIVDRFAHA